MNERIKELLSQAGFDPVGIERMGVMPHTEKFAALIIRECANIARSADDENVFGADFGHAIAHDIETQLGIKE